VGLAHGTLGSGLAAFEGLGGAVRRFFVRSHPDHPVVQGFEVVTGLLFIAMSLQMAQLSFLGLSLAYVMHPLMHHIPWNNAWLRPLVHLPAALMLAGLGLGGLALMGIQPVLLNFGAHF
jgi:hypothetical protein